MSNLLVKSFLGEETLGKAFWIVHVVFGLVLLIIVSVALDYAHPEYEATTHIDEMAVSLTFPYTLFSSICVWRCSKEAKLLWKILARAAVIFTLLNSVLSIIVVVESF